jgi:outer membrane cobalamin receptor
LSSPGSTISRASRPHRLILGATCFRNDFNNLIIFDPTTFILDNIGSALATGIEVTGLARVNERTDVRLAYTRPASPRPAQAPTA